MSELVQENLTTLSNHLRVDRQLGPLADVIEAISLATKSIAAKIRRARIDAVIGSVGSVNVQGEVQEKLDLISDELVLHCMRHCPPVAVYGSEEQENPVVLRRRSEGGQFAVLSDPLDGSSNIDVAVSVGTIFSVLPNNQDDATTADAVLQPGRNQVASGYVLYGSSVLLVLATSVGVDLYVLDPSLGEFVLVKAGVTMPAQKKIYSINEAYWNDFSDGLRDYLEFAHASGYGARYIGSMVADVHRTLLKGGVFIYPATDKSPEGKLRLMYEGNPMAYVMEQAGGAGSAGAGRILDVQPETLHQRTPVICGSSAEVEQVTSRLKG